MEQRDRTMFSIRFRGMILLVMALCTLMVNVNAQDKGGGINLSLWKNMCTQNDSTRTTALNIGLFSSMGKLHGLGVNVFGSVVYKDVHGLQLAGLANLAGTNMYGLQLAGISNVTAKHSSGLIVGGLVNILGSQTKGVVISGLTGIGGNVTHGIVASGLLSVTGEQTNGVVISGIANVATKAMCGVMISGMMNATGDEVCGLQIAGIANIAAGNSQGVQMALCNYATHGKGLQIGLFNYYRESMQGVQLGLVNANPNTRIQLMLYSGNSAYANIGVRFLNRKLYTIAGVTSMEGNLDGKFSIGVFYRAGAHISIFKNVRLSGDLGYRHVETCANHNELIPRHFYALQGRVNMEYQYSKRLGLFVSAGYDWQRYYNHSRTYDQGALVEAGIILF